MDIKLPIRKNWIWLLLVVSLVLGPVLSMPEGFKVDCDEQVDPTCGKKVDIGAKRIDAVQPELDSNLLVDRAPGSDKEINYYQWRIHPKPKLDHSEHMKEVLTEYGYGRPTKKYPLISMYNEFTPNMKKWDQMFNKHRLSGILSEKSEQNEKNDGMSKMKSFKYLALGNPDAFKGATRHFSQIKQKATNGMKLEFYPKDLNFNAIELCEPMYKKFHLKNMNKQQNIEIASVTSESPMIQLEHDFEDEGKGVLLRPGKKINVKVTVTAEVKEPVNTVVTFTLKNGYKLLYQVKFLGIENDYGIEPLIIDKARKKGSNMLNFSINNQAGEDLEFILSDMTVKQRKKDKETKDLGPITLYHAAMKMDATEPNGNCNMDPNNPNCYEKLDTSKFKIPANKKKYIFKIHVMDPQSQMEDLVVDFVLKDVVNNVKKRFAVPVYVLFNENEVDLYPPVLDFGIVYANSGIGHKINIKIAHQEVQGIRLGLPYIPKLGFFEYDFSTLVENTGLVTSENHYNVGTVILKTHGLKEGEYHGHILFCKDSVCAKDVGKTRLPFKFTVHKDPFSAKSKMHSFEITPKSTSKKKSYQITLLWLKNTFDRQVKIEDITCDDKELSLTYMINSKLFTNSDFKNDGQLCCVSSLVPDPDYCKGCNKHFIDDTNTGLHMLTMNPEEENEDIKIRYEYQLNKSKTIEVKFIVAWVDGTYVPIPVFIYDKSLACVFEYYVEENAVSENEKSPFLVSASQCHSIPGLRQLDFGPIVEHKTQKRTLTIANLNPMAIFIDKIRVEEPTCDGEESGSLLKLIPQKTIDLSTNKQKRDFSQEGKVFDRIYDPVEIEKVEHKGRSIMESSDFTIPSNSLVKFTVELENPKLNRERPLCKIFESTVYFTSFQSPNFQIGVSYQVIEGSVQFTQEVVEFDPAIPSVSQSQVLEVTSDLTWLSFVKSVKTENENKHVTVEVIKDTIFPKGDTDVVKITTVPFYYLNQYLTMIRSAMFQVQKLMGQPNMHTWSLDQNLTYFDIVAWQVEQKEWEIMSQNDRIETTTIVTMETNIEQNMTIPVKTTMLKPKLLAFETFDFGKVEVDSEKRGAITIYNPSSEPLEVSFFLAPNNFLEMVLDQLLSDEKLIKWKHLCDKATFFDPKGRKMCEGLIDLHNLSDEKRKDVVDYFIRNYFKFIMNGEVKDTLLKNFIIDQQAFLNQQIRNISEATFADMPNKVGESEENAQSIYSKAFNKVFCSGSINLCNWFSSSEQASAPRNDTPKQDPSNSEQYEELVETIKVRLNHVMDEFPQSLKNELESIFLTQIQNFYIERKSKCPPEFARTMTGYFNDELDCYSECDKTHFVIPGKSHFEYHCFHFHPTYQANDTFGYLLLKNNLTFIEPLKLTGTSGKAEFKVSQVTAPYYQPAETGEPKFVPVPYDKETDIDINFNLNMKYDIFRVKQFDNMSTDEINKQNKANFLGTEKITIKNIALIRKHYRRFNITNTGNFPAEITDVTLSNDSHKHNGFTVSKLENGGYELLYEPDFRHSTVTETLLVKTKNSVTEFKIQGYIPMYLIKFIDNNFRLTEVEDTIGNWYYLIILSFALFSLLLLGTELVEYVFFLKQKSINYSLLTELITAYEKAQELAQEEQKLQNLQRAEAEREKQSVSSAGNKQKATPKKPTHAKSRVETHDDPRAGIEAIKKRLEGKIDFTAEPDPKQKKPNKPQNKPQKDPKPVQSATTADKQAPLARHIKKNKNKDSFISVKKSESHKDPTPSKPAETKTAKPEKKEVKQEPKKVDSAPKPEKQVKNVPKETPKQSETPKSSKTKKRRDQMSNKDKSSFISTGGKETKNKQKAKENAKVEEPAPEPRPQAQPSVPLEKQSSKNTEYKRGKQSNQPKQGQTKDLPNAGSRPVAQIDLMAEFSVPEQHTVPTAQIPKDEGLPSSGPPVVTSKKSQEPPKVLRTTKSKKELINPPKQEEKQPEPKMVQSIETSDIGPIRNTTDVPLNRPSDASSKQSVKLYNRQESSQASVISEPSQKVNNRLSNASWAEPEEATDSYNPKSEYTEDDQVASSEDRHGEENLTNKSAESHSQDGSNRNSTSKGGFQTENSQASGSQGDKNVGKAKFTKNLPMRPGQSRYGQYNKNEYEGQKQGYGHGKEYYSSYDQPQYAKKRSAQTHQPNPKKDQGHQKTSSYQDYKHRLREQKQHKNFYSTNKPYSTHQNKISSYYGNKQEYGYAGKTRNATRGNKYREERNYTPGGGAYYYDNTDSSMHYPSSKGHKKSEKEPKEVEQQYSSQDEPQDYHEESKKEEEKKSQDVGEPEEQNPFFEEDSFKPGSFNMFQAFQDPGNDFSLFAPVQDNVFGIDDSIGFGFLDPSSNQNQKKDDEVLDQFGSLQELRNQSETYNYDIANKDISTKFQK